MRVIDSAAGCCSVAVAAYMFAVPRVGVWLGWCCAGVMVVALLATCPFVATVKRQLGTPYGAGCGRHVRRVVTAVVPGYGSRRSVQRWKHVCVCERDNGVQPFGMAVVVGT